jgi:formylglycine-generating enzyme required for sulfatase activity
MGFRFVTLWIAAFFLGAFFRCSASAENAFNDYVLKAVEEMPRGGGYSVEDAAMERLFGSVTVGNGEVVVDARAAQPSFCSSATYLVLLKALSLWGGAKGNTAAEAVWKEWVPRKLADGVGVWGRWNANGPGAAVLLRETGMGVSFIQKEKALPGDFLKIFWNEKFGSVERGHLVVFLGLNEDAEGHSQVVFWSSNQGMGYGVKAVDSRRIARMVFSRVTDPQRMAAVAKLSAKNGFLTEIAKRGASEREVAGQLGLKTFPVEKAYDAGFKETAAVPDSGGKGESEMLPRAGVTDSGIQVAEGEFPLAGFATLSLKVLRRGGEDGEPALRWCPAVAVEGNGSEGLRVAAVEDGIWLGEREVTQAEWERVMGRGITDQAALMLADDQSYGGKRMRELLGFGSAVSEEGTLRGKGEAVSIYYVCGDEAREYCARLTEMERLAGRLPDGYEYRLPTETEWERAFRLNGGGVARVSEGVDDGAVANAGRLGIRDLDANVSEMCTPVHASGEIEGLGELDVMSFGRNWNHRGVVLGEGSSPLASPMPKGFRLSNVGFRVAMGMVRGGVAPRR